MVGEVYAEIISTGNEVISGRIVDTNAAYLSRRLLEIGVTPAYRSTVGDNRERYEKVLETALSRAQVVITIGGLGPTEDDLTREVCAKVLDRKLVHSAEAEKHLRSVLKNYNIPCTEAELRQAYFPEGAVLIPNQVGTACGFVAMREDRLLASLSGVPSELEWMMELHLFPYLRETFPHLKWIPSMKVGIIGMSESALQKAVMPVLKKFPDVSWGITASQMVLTLSLSCAPGKDKQITRVLDGVAGAVGTKMFGLGDSTLPEVVADMLKQGGLTIAIAESCTGGLLSHLLTDVPGVSASLLESVVTYSDKSKIKRLGVKEETLAKHGAVSKQVAGQMALGALAASGADIAVSTTGIAGPKGGTPEKFVGLVYISIVTESGTQTKKFQFTGNRSDIKMRAANTALNMLRLTLMRLHPGL
jgi:nicotinamide-nucleotide amidase